MKENNENKIKTMVDDINKQFMGLNHYQRTMFAKKLSKESEISAYL